MKLPGVIERWVNTFQGAMDMERYLGLFAQDVFLYDGETRRTISGKDELAIFAQPFAHLTELSLKVLNAAVNEDIVFIEAELKATTPAGDPVLSRGVARFTVSREEISSAGIYMFRRNIAL